MYTHTQSRGVREGVEGRVGVTRVKKFLLTVAISMVSSRVSVAYFWSTTTVGFSGAGRTTMITSAEGYYQGHAVGKVPKTRQAFSTFSHCPL